MHSTKNRAVRYENYYNASIGGGDLQTTQYYSLYVCLSVYLSLCLSVHQSVRLSSMYFVLLIAAYIPD